MHGRLITHHCPRYLKGYTVVPAVCDHCRERPPGICDHKFDDTESIFFVTLPAKKDHLLYVTTFVWQKQTLWCTCSSHNLKFKLKGKVAQKPSS